MKTRPAEVEKPKALNGIWTRAGRQISTTAPLQRSSPASEQLAESGFG